MARVVEYGLIALLIFSPLPAASVHEWSILVIELAAILLTGVYIFLREKPHGNEILSSSVRWPKRLFVCFFLFLGLQILPLPVFLVKILSPNAWTSHQQYAVDPAGTRFLSLSLIPAFSVQRALELAAYFLIGFLVLKTVTKRRQIQRIFAALIALGSFEALYGLFELYRTNPRLLFYEKMHNLDSVTGTFVNRNHLSGYLEMLIPLAIGWLIARTDFFSLADLSWREKLLRLSGRRWARNVLLVLAVIVMSLGIVFSKSRSGVFVLVLIFILFIGLTAVFYGVHKARKMQTRNVVIAVFLLILSLSLYVGIDSVLQRFSVDNLLREGRPTHWANALKTFARFPLVGTGLGTFGSLVPPLAGSEGPVVLAHAHNDYLEYLSELGLVGSVLLLGGILYSLIVAAVILRSRNHPEIKGLGLGGLVSIIAILVHSLTDFNLHIPANMLLFSVILALTMVVAFYKKAPAPEETP